jgi:electron transfer flavoprotein beta subunit
MKAKRKPLDKKALADLGLDTANRMTTLEVMEPPARDAGVLVETVSELVNKLKNEAKVI